MAARLLRFAAIASGGLLVGMMLLTVADVALRYLANAPLTGTLELTELAMVALIMLALPYCAASGGHVRVDVLDRLLGRAGRFAGDLVTAFVSLAILGLLVWNTVKKTAEAYEHQDQINVLMAPQWPLYALIAISMSAFALVVAGNLVALFREGNDRE